MQMADELIRLDTTIIGIDSLINKASTTEEAKVLFTVKDVIYSQQRFTDGRPVKRGKWEKKKGYLVCSNCGMTVDTIGYTYEEQEEVFRYCSCCGYRMDGEQNDT